MPENIKNNLPFMNQAEVDSIAICLRMFTRKLNVLEWGSGNSTTYFSTFMQPGSLWTSLEHDVKWYSYVKDILQNQRSQLQIN